MGGAGDAVAVENPLRGIRTVGFPVLRAPEYRAVTVYLVDSPPDESGGSDTLTDGVHDPVDRERAWPEICGIRILGILGVTGRRYDEVIALACGADGSQWLATTLPEQRPQLAALLDFESTATAITDVSPLLVEVRDSGLFLHTDADVDRYRKAIARVAARAASTEDSATLIALAKAAWESA